MLPHEVVLTNCIAVSLNLPASLHDRFWIVATELCDNGPIEIALTAQSEIVDVIFLIILVVENFFWEIHLRVSRGGPILAHKKPEREI